jgi:hypothetical protein
MSALALARSGANIAGSAADAARAVLKNLDEAAMTGKSLKSFNIGDITTSLKNLPENELVTIGKSLDQKTINLLAKTSDGQEVIAKMGRTQVTVGTRISKAARAGGDFMRKFGTDTSNIMRKISNTTKKGLNRLAKKVDETPAQQAKKMKEEGPKVAKEVTEQAPDVAKAADDVVELSPEAKSGLKKIGMYTAGGTLVLMLLYNTMNPFRAIREAVKDAGKVGKGVKEVADAAAGAVKNAATSGFNFISFMAKNSWVSGSSSALLMLICIFFMASSFMGGPGKG